MAPARAATPRVHAIVGARIVTAPGQTIERGTIVLRDGVITAVGADVAVPADARVWQADSLTIYPGLIDPFVLVPDESPRAASGNRRQAAPAETRGAAHELAVVRAEARAVELLPFAEDQRSALRAAGFTMVQLSPRAGIVRGQTAVIGLGDGSANDVVVKPDASQVLALEAARDGYPGSLMGAISLIRQTLMDAKWYGDSRSLYAKSPQGKERPDENLSWAALQPLVAGRQPALFIASDMLEILRASSIAREAGITAIALGGGDEYKRVRDIKATGMSVIVPVSFPDAPDVSDPATALEASTEELRHWHYAPENLSTLVKAGVPFALTAHGLDDPKKFRGKVTTAIERGLKPADALAAMTTMPAKLLGLADRAGTIAPGKIANLTVTRGDLFSKKSKVVEVWVDGRAYDMGASSDSIKGNWTLQVDKQRYTLMVGTDRDTAVKLVAGSDTLTGRDVSHQGNRLVFTVQRGSQPSEDFDLRLRAEVLQGALTSPSHPGKGHRVVGVRSAEDKAGKKDKKAEAVATPVVMGNTEAWRMPAPAQPAAVLVKNATIWTAGPQGILRGADLLVRGGKIAAVGKGLNAPSNAVVIDGTGKHVAPGIIDEHSHSAILGNVNECTNSVTCEVRIGDVINSESANIYRQLAGGTTIMHLLHGSCNAIGGQCAVIKNKWGSPPDQLVFAEAPPTVKFALGENPKQSNWGSEATGRYPQSRAGVEQVIREAFQRAQDYRSAMAEYKQGKRKLPPRRDLQLEAVQEIIEGKRLIHCHSYRQDEMLMLLRLAESFGFRVNTLTHMQEAYKVADEIAAHGASAMGFTDWWAYKYEVMDGIPWNGYLLWDRGVNVGFNSDDSELARRLNTEAAKAVKYGGVPEEEAIKFVTLNPAKSLEVDQRVGSLEVGKDADFAVWSGSPLSPYSACEQTWIEGRKYFDRQADLAGRGALAQERAQLVAMARSADKEAGGGSARRWPPRYLDDANLSGSGCQGNEQPFMSETEARMRREGQEAGR
ncbi:MAG TPA: amidohydrolase family protein [Candidatus Eisenbacteria bacterium]|nr:amidohydrolase family protein [Candidatus Eisenbacteria bacterium]